MRLKCVRKDPLFWEPENQFERVDEWSEPKVFAFGDMDMLLERNLNQIGENYFRCADALIEQIKKNELEDFVAQFPIIYLMRHAIEVVLKHIIFVQTGIQADNEHSLHKLANKVQGIEPWALKRIQELNVIDPKSEDLRYGGVGARAPKFIGTELRFFQAAMHSLFDHLFNISRASLRNVAS
jgi:hypothetical protein